MPPGRDPAQRYEVVATVLESERHGPQICAGAVADSLPPQCGGPDLAGFSWALLDFEESVRGTTWADDVRLVGTYDGAVFHLTEPPTKGKRPPPEPFELDTPCPEPAGGWRVVDPAKVGPEDETRTMAYADRQPEYAGSWFDRLTDGPPTEGESMADGVLNVAFTRNAAAHAATLRGLWGGPLCVTTRARSIRELDRVQDRVATLRDEAAAAGVEILGSSRGEQRGHVEVSVLIADDIARRWFAERFGDLVEVGRGAFRPV